MADRGIIMSAPMVRALMDGRKTQTRRLAWSKRKPSTSNRIQYSRRWDRSTVWQCVKPGDRLWVRETFLTVGGPNALRRGTARFVYRATNDGQNAWLSPTWRPSIHMPRCASRLTLIVTEVRRQSLQEISEEDALAEGIYRQDPSPEEIAAGECAKGDFVFIAPGTQQGFGPRRDDPQWGPTAAFAYRCLWDSLHGAGSWDENPDVVKISFTAHHANIDRLGEEAA